MYEPDELLEMQYEEQQAPTLEEETCCSLGACDYEEDDE